MGKEKMTERNHNVLFSVVRYGAESAKLLGSFFSLLGKATLQLSFTLIVLAMLSACVPTDTVDSEKTTGGNQLVVGGPPNATQPDGIDLIKLGMNQEQVRHILKPFHFVESYRDPVDIERLADTFVYRLDGRLQRAYIYYDESGVQTIIYGAALFSE